MELGPPVYDGVVHAAYANERDDVAALVPPGATAVLDIGCSVGMLGQALRRRGHTVTGIESNVDFAEQARTRLDRVISADVEELARAGAAVGGPYDCVVMADVLEHLRDPWTVTSWSSGLLRDGGSVVISVPNVRHLRLVRQVLLGARWPYDEVGIFDRTHLRWFGRQNLDGLLADTGLVITELRRTYALRANPAAHSNRLARLLGDFGTLQFVFRAEGP
jgi:2-polyprenyl-3-methyl-5-hydroxy-6-metoxy-1,4-benzoquinol methylase